MLKNNRLILFIFAIALLIVPLSSASAETKIAVVDVEKLLTESSAARSIQKQIQAKRESFMAKLSKEEQELKKTENEITNKKASMSAEEFAKEKNAFEKKFMQTRQMAQAQKRSLDQATLKAMSRLQSELYKVVQALADEKGYDLVLAKQGVVIGEKSLEISDDVMKRLNESVSEIKLELSETTSSQSSPATAKKEPAKKEEKPETKE